MAHLVSGIFENPVNGLWVFLSISAVALFVVFLPAVTFFDKQHKEREAFYKAETIRRITEASGEGAKAALELLKAQSRMESQKLREGMKMGGLVCIAVGAALSLFLLSQHSNTSLVGLIPGLIGVALLVYVYVMAAPLD